MKLSVDRSLPVPLGTQLRGLIEHGIVSGEFTPGERLPSVRDLAESLGVAPMTVSQVYRYLRNARLIEARPGDGTYVAERNPDAAIAPTEMSAVTERLDQLIHDVRWLGLSRADFTAMVQTRFAAQEKAGETRRVVTIGMFEEATRDYAAAIASHLGADFQVGACTLDRVRSDEGFRKSLRDVELVVTFPNRQREIAALLPRLRVVSIRFLPTEKTRQALAGLDPYARLAVVSHFPDFLPMLKSGAQRFAPHVAECRAVVLDTPELGPALDWADVVVYTTGAERVLDLLDADQTGFEYRYGPDLVDLDRTVLPLLRRERAEDVSLTAP
ncbi:GntR family transcriptional regulator [Labrys monachus]|uniref:DNA-binding transcriptional regulator YhcF (GntR family) n=1 Tax=Labrys monachus TaxID=217067 RepID=A0ABU0FNK8_9HYPH|nr:GntR family transcriptional regulator [Labrys monachus]MDQ0396202.1 DNA-binding transcriptional regulator YhcF (GntR family) [Labrys monachus]